MSQNSIKAPDFKVSHQRRLMRLEPVFADFLLILKNPPSEKTQKKYKQDYNRMLDTNSWPEQIGQNSRRSFNAYRAALIWNTILEIENIYRELCEQSCSISGRAGHHLLDDMEHYIAILTKYPPNSKTETSKWEPPAKGAVHKSKRCNIGTLPKIWRQKLLKACPPSSKYYIPLLVLSLTGLRPSELQKGVSVNIQAGFQISVTIKGAKLTAIAGQPERTLWFSSQDTPANDLAKRVRMDGDGSSLVVAIKSADALCSFVRRLSKRVFKRHKYVVSPYSFRHSFASDLKSEKAPPEEIGAMLGHAVDRSQRGYGCALQGRTLCRVRGFSSDRPVRQSKLSEHAEDWVAARPGLAKRNIPTQSPVSHAMQMK